MKKYEKIKMFMLRPYYLFCEHPVINKYSQLITFSNNDWKTSSLGNEGIKNSFILCLVERRS